MRTIISFSSRTIKAVQGVYDGKRFKIAASCAIETPKNSYANMTIIDDRREEMQAAVRELRDKLKRFKECEVLLDNPFCVTTELRWLGAKGFERTAKNAFLYRKDFDEAGYVTDYMILEKETKETPALVLFGAVKKDVIRGFLGLFKEAGLNLTRLDMSLAGLLKLTAQSSSFSRKNAVINIVDGDVLRSCSFRDKGALFIKPTPISENEGTERYYDKIAHEVFEHARFKKNDRASGGVMEDGHLFVYDMNANSEISGHERAMKANRAANDADYCSIGVRSALSDGAFAGFDEADRFAPLLGALI